MKLFLFLILFIVSCSDDMKKYSKLGELRVLGISVDTPEVNSAANVTVTPFVSYPDGQNTNLSISWQACVDPGILYGAKIDCSESDLQIDEGIFTFDMSILSADYYTGNITAINLAIPAGLFTYLATLDQDIQFNGIDVLVILEISDLSDSSKKLKTFKRIKVSTKTNLNQNPQVLGSIQVNGQNISNFPNLEAQLSIDSISSGEIYEFSRNGERLVLNEFLTISWFSNEGEFQFSRVDTDESVKFDPKGASSGVIVGVIRDNRGGIKIIKNAY